MKKILALVLALTMIVGMSIPAFAATEFKTVPASKAFDVEAEYVFVDNTTPVYGVDIAWDDTLAFVYTVEQGQWNPDAEGGPAYEDDKSAKWNVMEDTTVITVTNKSNVAITASASWTDGTVDLADAEFTADLALEDAVDVENDANVGTITATVTINEGAVINKKVTLGTITVTITAA